MKKNNREFLIVTYTVLILLLFMCGYFCYYMFNRSEAFINNPYNKRISNLEKHIIRGDIITSDGVTVAETIKDSNGNEKRVYPKGRAYAHAVGFNTMGLMGMENDYNFSLIRSHSFILTRLQNEIFEKKNMGDTLVLSIDSRLQEAAFNGMESYQGTVIALDPETGDILCNISKPDFDPNTIEADWESLNSDSNNSSLLNRATQGLYPPGSTFKILTALEHMREVGSDSNTYLCEGEFTYDDSTIHCYHGIKHGEEDFSDAFSNSCNSVFAKIAIDINKTAFKSLGEELLFNTTLPTKLYNVRSSSLNIDENTDNAMMMQTAIGQGTTLVTPIHMAMIAASIDNDGVLMKPKMVKEIVNDKGVRVRTVKPEKYGSIISESEALYLKSLMRKVVTEGTAKRLSDAGYEAYGKTGTAEFSSNSDEAHSWFVGFAEKDDQKIAIAVIMEGAGAGSEYATPLAKKVFDAYFNNP